MKNLLITFSTLFVVCIFLPTNVFAQDTHYIGASNDNDFKTISDALKSNDVDDGDLLIINDAEHFEIEIEIDKDITIKGNGVDNSAISGESNKKKQIFLIEAGSTVVLQDLTIKNSNSNKDGGAIVNNGTLDIRYCKIIGNETTSQGGGGAIFNTGVLNISLTEISNNLSIKEGGAILNYNNGTLTIKNSIIHDNRSILEGAGVFSTGSNVSVEIENTLIVHNTSESNGGGVFIGGTAEIELANIVLSGNTISKNISSADGGGINMIGGSLTLVNNIIAENEAANETYSDIKLNGVEYSLGANIIGINDPESYTPSAKDIAGTLTIHLDPQLDENFVPLQTSPAINLGENLDYIDENSVDVYGDPRIFDGEYKIVDIGAVELQDEPLASYLIEASTEYVDFGEIPTGAYTNISVTLSNVGQAPINIDSIVATGGFEVSLLAQSLINQSLLTDITIPVQGSIELIIAINPANEGVYNGEVTVYNNSDNEPELTITTVADAFNDIDYIIGEITENTTWCDEVVFIGGDVSVNDAATLTICEGTRVEFLGDFSLTIKGQLHVDGTSSANVTFTTDSMEWAGIRFESPAQANESYFNYALIEKGAANKGDAFNKGGGVFIGINSVVKLNYSILRNNTAKDFGGGIYNEGNLEILESSISNNAVTESLGISNSNGGGGISNDNGILSIINSEITSNSSAASGGGVYSQFDNSSVYIENTYITENTAAIFGGGIFSVYGSELSLVSCVVASNSATTMGGGIAGFLGSTFSLINSTIANNSADIEGGGIASVQAPVVLTNTLFTQNIANNYGAILSGSDLVSNGYNIIDNQGAFNFPANTGDIVGTEEVPINPRLNEEFVPDSNSIALNSGTPDVSSLNLPANDITGSPRIYTDDNISRVDIGAFEYQSTPAEDFFLKIDKDTVEFSVTLVTESRLDEIELSNIATGTIQVYSITAPEGFLLAMPNGEYSNTLAAFSILPSESVKISIKFTPALDQFYRGDIVIENNDAFLPTKTVFVSGQGNDDILLEGIIDKDTLICADTINIVGELTVNAGATLEICAGSVVRVTNGVSIYINGRLFTNGTEGNPILFTNFESGTKWAGIVFDYNELNLSPSELVYTTFENSTSENGGAIKLESDAEVNIKESILRNNIAAEFGGAIFNNGILNIENSVVENNTTSNFESGGGGIYSEATLTLTNTTVSNNDSPNGGGIIIEDAASETYINYSKIINNKSEVNGAGINIADGFLVSIQNSLIADNLSVSGQGGGIYSALAFSGNLQIDNSTISKNQSALSSGGLFMADGTLAISHTIIANNIVPVDDPEFRPDIFINGTTVSNGNNLIGNIGRSFWTAGPNDVWGSAAFPEDAKLDENYKPTTSSLVVNLGNPNGSFGSGDLDGNPRIYDGSVDIIDMGASEYQGEKLIEDLILSYDTTEIRYFSQAINYPSEPYTLRLSNYEANDYIIISSLSVPEGFRFSVNGSEYGSGLTEDINILINQTAYIDIVFEPTAVIDYEGLVTIVSNSTTPLIEIPISGTGAIIQPSFSFTSTPPVIDGILESDWNIAAYEALLVNVETENTASAEEAVDLEAGFRALWDNDSIYFIVTIADDILYDGGTANEVKDNLELFLDFNNSKLNDYESDDYFIRFVWNNGNYIIENGSDVNDINFAQTNKADLTAYYFEFAIPWSSVTAITPVAGTEIGIDLNVIDNDGSGVKNILAWYSDATDKAVNPAQFGTAVLLDGEGVDPLVPVMQISATQTEFDINCESNITLPVTISNTGVGRDLIYYSASNADLETVLANFSNNYQTVTDLIPERYDFTEGETGISIQDGGDNMYEIGNYLNTNFNDKINYSNNLINVNSDFGYNSKYFTSKVQGLFLLAADASDLDYFEINGVAGAKDAATHQASTIHLNYNGLDYTGYIRKVSGTDEPSINHLIICETTDGVEQTFDPNPSFNKHTLSNINQVGRIYYLLFAGTSGRFYDDYEYEEIMYAFVQSISIEEILGEVPTGETTVHEFVIPTSTLPDGVSDKTLTILSNDPSTTSYTINYSIEKGGFSTIATTQQSLNFGEVEEGHFGAKDLVIINDGCSPLFIDSISSTHPFFFAQEDVFIVAPNDTIFIEILFAPEEIGEYSEYLTVHNNDEPLTMLVTGLTKDIVPPEVHLALVSNLNPLILYVEFNEDILTNGIGGFSLSGTAASITGISLANSDRIALTLSESIAFGEALHLSYDSLSLNITDASSNKNKLLSFTDLGVVNLVEYVDTVAPILTSAKIENENPFELILTFNEPVRASDISGITINGTLGTPINISGNDSTLLLLELDSRVYYGEVLSFNYSSAAGTITDVAEVPNPLQDIQNLPIINNVEYVDFAPPELDYSVVENETPNIIKLFFNEAVEISNPDGFAITGTAGEITGFSGTGTSIIQLNLSANVAYGEFVQISYDNTSAGITDYALIPNDLEPFGPVVVINNVLYSGEPQDNPIITATSVENSNPNQILLAFDEVVTVTDQTGFSISNFITNITGISGSGSDILILTIDNPAEHNDLLLLSYSSGNVKDTEDKIMLPFDNYTVINNVLPIDDTPPELLIAKVTNDVPNKIVLEFDENINFQDASGFTVSGISSTIISASSGGTNSMLLELSSDLIFGEVLELSYDETTGNVIDAAIPSNKLVSFIDFNVSNYVEYADIFPPEVVKVETEIGNPFHVQITFNEPVTFIDLSGFSINGTLGDIISISGDGTTIITLTLDIKVVFGEALTLNYTPGNVTDLAINPNSLQTISDYSIINNAENDFTYPEAIEAVIRDASSNVISVKFSERVLVSDASGFSLSGTASNIVSLTGSEDSTLVFTLDAPVIQYEQITFIYDGTGNITDRAGNPIIPFEIEVDNFVGREEAVAPFLLAAVAEKNAKDKVYLAFDEPIYAPDFIGFTVNGIPNTIIGIEGSGTEVIALVLDTRIDFGDVLTLSYDGTGNITDIAMVPNALEAISNFPVTNNILDQNIYYVGVGRDFDYFHEAFDLNSSVDDGDILIIADPVHEEKNITVNRSVIIRGAGIEISTVSGANNSDIDNNVFTIEEDVAAVFEDFTIAGNESESNGGAIGNLGTLAIINCAIINNTLSIPPVEINGGGAIINSGILTISTSLISGNHSGSHGGGVFNNSGGDLSIENCTIKDNAAINSGGGIVSNINTSIQILNSLIVSNHSGQKGGGILIGGLTEGELTTAFIAGNTISKNTSTNEGGGLFMFGGTLTFTNNIIAENTSSLSINYADMQLEQVDYRHEHNIVGIINLGDINVSQQDFVGTPETPFDPELDDGFVPLASSFAINYGVNSDYILVDSKDIYGNPRIYNGNVEIVDIGAVEFQGEPLPTYLIRASDSIVAFGDVPVGTYTNQSLVIDNLGQEELTIDSVVATGGFEVSILAIEKFKTTLSGFTIPAHSSVELIVSIEPQDSGIYAGDIIIHSDADNAPKLTIVATANALLDIEYVIGDIISDTTWCADVIQIGGDIEIKEGATLTICAGTIIEFLGYYDIKVIGQIHVDGTAAENVTFTSLGEQWSGLQIETLEEFDGQRSSYFEYTIIENAAAIDEPAGNGDKDSRGGALYINSFSDVRLSNSIVRNNTAIQHGGGIYNEGKLEINSSQIINNTTTIPFDENDYYGGGGISNRNNGNLSVVNSTISNNHSSNDGGGLEVEFNSTQVYLENTYITDNIAEIGGGGIFAREGNQFKIVNCVIANNSAVNSNGGGIVAIRESKIDISNTTVYLNNAGAEGGGIYSANSEVNIVNTLISDNQAPLYAEIFNNDNTAIISAGYNLIRNKGSFDFISNYGDIVGNENTPINPRLNPDYSPSDVSIAINNGTPDISELNLPANDIVGNPRVYTDSVSLIDIGAFEYQGTPAEDFFLFIDKDSIDFPLTSNNESSFDELTLSSISSGTIEVYSIVPPGGFQVAMSGGEYKDSLEGFSLLPDEKVTISIKFTPLQEVAYSGNIVIENNDSFKPTKTVYVNGFGNDNNLIEGEIKQDTLICTDTLKVIGELIVNPGVTLEICAGTVVQVQKDVRILIKGRLLTHGTIDNPVVFTNENGTGKWASIFFQYTASNPLLSELDYTIIEKSKSQNGGCINSEISAEVVFRNCTFRNNEATKQGGAIYNRGGMLIENCIIENNLSNGGRPDGGGGITNNSILTIRNSTISDNESNFHGGGIYITGGSSQTYIYDSKIINNKSAKSGGGIGTFDGSLIVISNSLVAENLAYRGKGGGVHTGVKFDGSVQVYNSTITQNESYFSPGGLFMGGAGTVDISHTIIANNIIPEDDPEFRPDILIQGTTESTGNNLIGNIGRSYWNAGPNDIWGSAAFPEDPKLDANYRPTASSLVVNLGNPDGTFQEFDLDGNDRIYNGSVDIIDIGAYEYRGEKSIEDLILAYDTTAIRYFAQPIDLQSDPYTLALSNYEANDYITISELSVPDGFRFSINGSEFVNEITEGIEILINQTAYVDIVFEPTAEVDYEGFVTIVSNSTTPFIQIPISGTGAVIKPSFTYTEKSPVIDGILEDSWNVAAYEELLIAIDKNTSSVEAVDLNAGFRALWDNDSIYFIVTIADDILYDGGSTPEVKDNLELFLDFNNSKLTSYDSDDYFIRFVWNNNNYIIENGNTVSDINFVQTSKADSTAYYFEFAIPWSSVTTVTPVAGTEIGIDMNVVDNDGSGVKNVLAWYSNATNKDVDPSNFGTAVLLDGAGEDPLLPVMQVSATETEFIVNCEDSVILPVTISNTGAGRDLMYYSYRDADLETVLANFNANYQSVTGLIPSKFNFTGGESGFAIDNGGENMYDIGNYLNTNFKDKINYSNNTILSNSDFGYNSKYFTSKVEGLFLLAVDASDLESFEINGVAGAKGAVHQISTIQVNYNGLEFTGYIRKVSGAEEPSINHLIITQTLGGIEHSYDPNPNFNKHILTNLNQASRIYYLLFAGSSGAFIEDWEYEEIMLEFIQSISTSEVLGTVQAGESVIHEFVIPTGGLPSDVTNGSVVILSNDLVNSSDTVDYSIDKMGLAEANPLQTEIDFGEVFEDHFYEEYLQLANNGCVPLQVDSIVSSHRYFFVLEEQWTIAPGDTTEIPVYFAPEEAGEFFENIDLYTNDDLVSIALYGITKDTIPPTVNYAVVTNLQPSELIVNFSEDIISNGFDGFTLQGTNAAITGIDSLSSQSIILLLSGNVGYGESVKLDYNGESNSIIDASKTANQMRSFVGFPVANGVEYVDTIPPSVIGATVLNENPKAVILTFNEVVRASDVSGITINGTLGTPLGISGSNSSELTVELDEDVYFGEILTFNYSASAGTITDTAEVPNALLDIQDLTIRNYVEFVDFTPPELDYAVVENASPTIISLHFDELVQITNPDGFTISGTAGSITGFTGSGTDVISLELSANVEYGEFVQVAYDSTFSGVADYALVPNELGSFGPVAVFNNVLYAGAPQDNPIVIGSSVENDNPTQLVLAFDEIVTVSDATGFSIANFDADILGVSGSGNDTLVLTINTPAAYNDLLLLSYASSGNIADLDSNPLAPFSNYTVINNVLPIDSSPPVLLTAVVYNENTNIIALEFNEAITFADAQGFTVKGISETIISATSSASNNLLLELQTNVMFGDVVYLDYDQTKGNVTDTAANPNSLESFTDFFVSNYVEYADIFPPEIVKMESEIGNPYNIQINFNESVTFEDFTGFSIAGTLGEIISIAGDSSTLITLTLDIPVVSGETLLLSYSSGNVIDLASVPNSLLPFTDNSVLNNAEEDLVLPEAIEALIPDIVEVTSSSSQIYVRFSERVLITDVSGLSLINSDVLITDVAGSGDSVLVLTLNQLVAYGDLFILKYNGLGTLIDRSYNEVQPFKLGVKNYIGREESTPPVLLSAVVENSKPNRIDLTFDEIVLASGFTGFSISGVANTIIGIEKTESEIISLILDSDIRWNDTLALSYNGTGDITDIAVVPNALEPIVDFPIANDLEYVDIVITKVVDNIIPVEQDIITYSIEVTNNGSAEVTNLVVSDNLPAGLTYISGSPTDGTWNYPNWSIGTLSSGSTAILEITAKVDIGTKGVLTNTATHTQNQTDLNLSQDKPVVNIIVFPVSQLVTVKTLLSGDTVPSEGDIVSYQIIVLNGGPAEATNVTLSDFLPEGLTATAANGTVSQGTYDSATGLWTIGVLPEVSYATLLLEGTINAGTGGDTIINVTAAALGDQIDYPDEYDNLEVRVVVDNTADIVTIKNLLSGDATPSEGDTISYSITVNNKGLAQASNVSLTDLLPEGLTATSNNGIVSAGVYNSETGVWLIDLLNNGEIANLILEGTIDTGQGGNTIVNVATAASSDQLDPTQIGDDLDEIIVVNKKENTAPVAVVDTVIFTNNEELEYNLLENDYDPDNDEIYINTEPIIHPVYGTVIIETDGSFSYYLDNGYQGIDSFKYEICDSGEPSLCSSAYVIILSGDNDKDGIVDPIDYDDDNDGIPDYLESNVGSEQNGISDDSDGDGIPNDFDIDSDNDGITDNVEAQNEDEYIPPSGIDENLNGWDDSYDTFMGGVELIPVDLDLDGVSDFLDLDTDNDGVLDEIEGNDANADGIADILKTGFDEDNDGLDDAYDNWLLKSNATGSISPLQDTDNDGTRDWRDNNDDDDSLLTFDEDTNGDGDYSNDDSNGNGIPDYLDTDDVCKLILPNGFSPNDDGINDLFKIACLHNYPNAKMEIYNRWGNMVYEKEQYGNEDTWGTIEAWWDGRSTNNLTVGSERLPPATYFYLLNLNDGSEAKTGFVFLNR